MKRLTIIHPIINNRQFQQSQKIRTEVSIRYDCCSSCSVQIKLKGALGSLTPPPSMEWHIAKASVGHL